MLRKVRLEILTFFMLLGDIFSFELETFGIFFLFLEF